MTIEISATDESYIGRVKQSITTRSGDISFYPIENNKYVITSDFGNQLGCVIKIDAKQLMKLVELIKKEVPEVF